MQQGLTRLPIGRGEAALSIDLDAESATFRPNTNRVWLRIEQDGPILGYFDLPSGQLTVGRRLALADAAMCQRRGEQDYPIRFDKAGRWGETAGKFLSDEVGRQRTS